MGCIFYDRWYRHLGFAPRVAVMMADKIKQIVGEAIFIASEYDDEGNFRLDGDLLANEVLCGLMRITLDDFIEYVKHRVAQP